MQKAPDKLVIFTQGFPYEKGEVFLQQEIHFLAAAFEKILIIPYWAEGKASPLPANVSVKILPDIWQIAPGEKRKSNFKYAFNIIQMFLGECIAQRKNPKVWKLAKENFALVKYFYALVDLLDPVLKEFPADETVFYSYWCSDRATVLGILRKSGKIKTAISRAHGFDLYPDQNSYIRFRPFQLANLNYILPISNHGKKYLEGSGSHSGASFKTFRLGVADHGLNPFSASAPFTIVSCSVVASHKRVKEMATEISRLPFPVRWVHFGNGPQMKEVEEILASALPHILYEFPGFVSNASILEFYSQNPVHLFLNFSISEGIPFTMMEAISFGIPLLGVDVGGVSEIVTPGTGILLPAGSKPSALGPAIATFRDFEKFGPDFRKGIKHFWAGFYEEKKNFGEFISFLKQL